MSFLNDSYLLLAATLLLLLLLLLLAVVLLLVVLLVVLLVLLGQCLGVLTLKRQALRHVVVIDGRHPSTKNEFGVQRPVPAVHNATSQKCCLPLEA